ncbi:MAG: hypothetical protein ACXQTT_03590 [Candidatus Syntropharchaeia archaeon]
MKMEKEEMKRIVKAINRELDALSEKSSEALVHAFYYDDVHACDDNDDDEDSATFVYENFIENISKILEKHGFSGWDILDLQGEGGEFNWSYGQTLIYRNDDNIHIEVITDVSGSFSSLLHACARIYRVYSYDYDDEDNVHVHFAYKVEGEELIDCSDELIEEI